MISQPDFFSQIESKLQFTFPQFLEWIKDASETDPLEMNLSYLSAFEFYLRYFIRLMSIDQNSGYSDLLRDEMDKPWDRLTGGEKNLLDEVISWIRENKIIPITD